MVRIDIEFYFYNADRTVNTVTLDRECRKDYLALQLMYNVGRHARRMFYDNDIDISSYNWRFPDYDESIFEDGSTVRVTYSNSVGKYIENDDFRGSATEGWFLNEVIVNDKSFCYEEDALDYIYYLVKYNGIVAPEYDPIVAMDDRFNYEQSSTRGYLENGKWFPKSVRKGNKL